MSNQGIAIYIVNKKKKNDFHRNLRKMDQKKG